MKNGDPHLLWKWAYYTSAKGLFRKQPGVRLVGCVLCWLSNIWAVLSELLLMSLAARGHLGLITTG